MHGDNEPNNVDVTIPVEGREKSKVLDNEPSQPSLIARMFVEQKLSTWNCEANLRLVPNMLPAKLFRTGICNNFLQHMLRALDNSYGTSNIFNFTPESPFSH